MAPAGWARLTATFALAADQSIARVAFEIGDQEVQFGLDAGTMALVRRQREVVAESEAGPWWRMILRQSTGARVDIDYDYGEIPFPEGWMLTPHAYAADLVRYPRRRLPMWLAAFLRHDGRQQRTAPVAAAQARLDAERGVRATNSTDLLPEPTRLWAWWALLSAGFLAAGSVYGPRILPAVGVFEGAISRSGSTLYVLPGGRAVLSGGVWNSPELDAAYNDAAELPKLYAGAPHWVAGSVLNPRVNSGMLSFCYWYDGHDWYRGESPLPDQFGDAIPAVRDADMVVDMLLHLVSENPTTAQWEMVEALVSAAEAGNVLRSRLEAFGDSEIADIDAAMYHLEIAGLTPVSVTGAGGRNDQ